LRDLGLTVILGDEARGLPRYPNPFLRIEQRVVEFVGMLRDPDIDAIWCLDGGAGASYLLPRLASEWAMKPWTPKPVIGFSDVNFLLLYLVKLGHVCFLGANVSCEFDQDEKSLVATVQAFRRGLPPVDVALADLPVELVQEGDCQGHLVGGTFSVLREITGTPYCPNLEGAILFFEEHGTAAPGENEYLLWERLQGIELGKFWSAVKGFVVGEISCSGPYGTDADLFPQVWEILDRSLRSATSGPIVLGFPFGVSTMATPIPIGVQAELSARRDRFRLSWELPEGMR
jgi:muramoyltetrapeptide carboxypeptidase